MATCSACTAGFHDLCRGDCQDCGERYHSDPDDDVMLNRQLEDPFEWDRPKEPQP